MEEIKRILLTRKRVLIFLMLLVYCIFYFGKPMLADNAFEVRDSLAPYLEAYRDMPLKDVNYNLKQITKDGTDYSSLDIGGKLITMQVQNLMEYPEFLEGIKWQAGTMLGVSIFQTNNKTVLKTARDYSRLDGLELTLGADYAVSHILWRDTTDWLLVGWMLLVVFSFLEERKRGLWNLVCASAGGREKLAVGRFFALLTAALLGASVFTALEAVSGWIQYGGVKELGRILQSVQSFNQFTVPMTIGQFWLYYGFIRFLGAFLAGFSIWLFFELIPDTRLAAVCFALFAALEYVIFRIFPSSALVDTVNLFMWISPKRLLTEYAALDPFGIALSREDVYGLVGVTGLMIGLPVMVLRYRFRKPKESIRWVTILTDSLRRFFAPLGYHGRLFFQELYKLLIPGRGILVVIAVVFVSFSLAQSPYLGNDGGVVNQALEVCYRQAQGSVTQESWDYLQKRQDTLARLEYDLENVNYRYEHGYIDELEHRALSIQYRDLGVQRQALEKFAQEMTDLSQIPGSYIVPHWVYAELFGIGSNTVALLSATAFLSIALLCVLYATTEGATGMGKIRKATYRGRSSAIVARYGAGLVFAFALNLLIWAMQLYLLWDSYGALPLWEAPLRSLQYFRSFSGNLSIGSYWCILTGIRGLAAGALGMGLLWVTDRLQK